MVAQRCTENYRQRELEEQIDLQLQEHFDQDLTDPGVYLFKLEVVDTQTPPLTSADSNVVSVTVPVPAKAAPNTVVAAATLV